MNSDEPREEDKVTIALGPKLGAEADVFTQKITLYIPNKDQDDKVITDQEEWVRQARQLLTEMNDGATAFPPADGTWRTDEGKILWESTRLVYSYIRTETFLDQLDRLTEFLHRFGRETNQGEVVFEFDKQFFRVKKFDR